jgi:hypothetical protein
MITEQKKLTKEDLQRICVVILKNDFTASWSEIADALSIPQKEAKALYMQLIRLMENEELKLKTQDQTK